MSFNILSQYLNESFSYQFVVLPEGAGDFLNWSIRKQMIIQEIKRWSPDIVCLQELDIVDKKEFFTHFTDSYEIATDSILDLRLYLNSIVLESGLRPLGAALFCSYCCLTHARGAADRTRMLCSCREFTVPEPPP